MEIGTVSTVRWLVNVAGKHHSPTPCCTSHPLRVQLISQPHPYVYLPTPPFPLRRPFPNSLELYSTEQTRFHPADLCHTQSNVNAAREPRQRALFTPLETILVWDSSFSNFPGFIHIIWRDIDNQSFSAEPKRYL